MTGTTDRNPGRGRGLSKGAAAIILGAIILLGVGLRIAYLSEFSKAPDFRAPHVDADFHNYWARGLAFGDWTLPKFAQEPEIQQTPFFRPPGYPYYLAAVYKIVGPGYLGPRIFQILLGLTNIFLAYRLTRRYYGRAAALIAAALVASPWIFIYFEMEFQEPVVSTLILLGLLLTLSDWARRGGLGRVALTGLLIGLQTLIRPNSGLLLFPILAWMLWIDRKRARSAGLRTTAVLAACIGLTILPATVRNLMVGHDFVPISSNGGINFYIGNNDRADGLVWGTIPEIGTLDTCYDHLDIVHNLERKLGRPLKHSQVSGYFAKQAWRWIGEHPGRALVLLGKKTLLFWGPLEAADNKEVQGERANARVLRDIPITFPVALSLGLAGLGFGLFRRRSRKETPSADAADTRRHEFILLLLGILGVWYLSYLPFAICSRYRVPLIAPLVIMGAVFIRELADRASAREWREVLTRVLVLAGLLVVAHLNLAGYKPSMARWHYQRAIAYNRLDRLEPALDEYKKAVDLNPNYGSAVNDLGAVLVQLGRVRESVPYFQRALQMRPRDPTALYNMGAVLEMTGDARAAKSYYEQTLGVKPDHRGARAGLDRMESGGGSTATQTPATRPMEGTR